MLGSISTILESLQIPGGVGSSSFASNNYGILPMSNRACGRSLGDRESDIFHQKTICSKSIKPRIDTLFCKSVNAEHRVHRHRR